MMQGIREWAFAICLTLIGTAVFGMLVPKGKIEKSIQFTISLLFILCLVSPFVSGEIDLDFSAAVSYAPQADSSQLEDVVTQQVLDVTAARLGAETERLLTEAGHSFEKVAVNMTIDQDNRIFISDIRVVLPSGVDTGAVSALIEKNMGVLPQITYSGAQESQTGQDG
ncbi:MAG TPA: stage III sporulation protein AF [Firmicutes bacterium]|nr:stage III sporulation protein AF [Bacillota bacterium]